MVTLYYTLFLEHVIISIIIIIYLFVLTNQFVMVLPFAGSLSRPESYEGR